jgi:hypothetical protein
MRSVTRTAKLARANWDMALHVRHAWGSRVEVWTRDARPEEIPALLREINNRSHDRPEVLSSPS